MRPQKAWPGTALSKLKGGLAVWSAHGNVDKCGVPALVNVHSPK